MIIYFLSTYHSESFSFKNTFTLFLFTNFWALGCRLNAIHPACNCQYTSVRLMTLLVTSCLPCQMLLPDGQDLLKLLLFCLIHFIFTYSLRESPFWSKYSPHYHTVTSVSCWLCLTFMCFPIPQLVAPLSPHWVRATHSSRPRSHTTSHLKPSLTHPYQPLLSLKP